VPEVGRSSSRKNVKKPRGFSRKATRIGPSSRPCNGGGGLFRIGEKGGGGGAYIYRREASGRRNEIEIPLGKNDGPANPRMFRAGPVTIIYISRTA